MRILCYRRQIFYYSSLVAFSMVLWLLHISLNNFPRNSKDPQEKLRKITEITLDTNGLNGIENIPSSETISLAVVACRGRIAEAMTMLKSAVLFSQGISLHVLAFVDEETRAGFTSSIVLLQEDARASKKVFEFDIFNVWFPPEGENVWKNLYAPCSTQRIFFASQLPTTDSLMYVDSDTFFISDVRKLWDHFQNFNDVQWIAAASEDEPTGDGWYNLHSKVPYYGKRGLNTGVLLLNLTRMRAFGLEEKAKVVQENFHNDLYWGDQDIINAVLHDYPESVYELPCSYNFRTSHCKCIYEGDCRCHDAESNGVYIIHGNRQAFTNNQSAFFQNMYETWKHFSLRKNSQKDLCEEYSQQYIQQFPETLHEGCVNNSHLFYKQLCAV